MDKILVLWNDSRTRIGSYILEHNISFHIALVVELLTSMNPMFCHARQKSNSLLNGGREIQIFRGHIESVAEGSNAQKRPLGGYHASKNANCQIIGKIHSYFSKPDDRFRVVFCDYFFL